MNWQRAENNMNYCYGIVEDRNDPLKIGRVRVRIHGYHTYRKDKLATPDLPWSHVIMPATTAGLGGFGLQHSLVEGTTVFGFFRDDDMQDFVVMGVQQGIVQDGFMETVSDELLGRTMDKGFADPRRATPESYNGSLDGSDRKSASSSAGNTLTASLQTAPVLPKSWEFKENGRPELDEFTVGEQEQDLPYYPLKASYNATDITTLSTGDGDYSSRDFSMLTFFKEQERKIKKWKNKADEPKPTTMDELLEQTKNYGSADAGFIDETVTGIKSLASPLYPYNKAIFTESGHSLELDDTRHNERIAVEHRTGTFYEIDHVGNEMHRVVSNNYTLICKDNEIYVGGKVNIKVLGDAKIDVPKGDIEIKGGKDGLIDVTGKLDIKAGDNITFISNEEVLVRAQKFRPNS